MIDNTKAFQWKLLSYIIAVNMQLKTNRKEKTRQVLIVSKSDLWSLSQKKHVRGSVSNQNIYENVSRSLFDVLPELLQTPLLMNRVQFRFK